LDNDIFNGERYEFFSQSTQQFGDVLIGGEQRFDSARGEFSWVAARSDFLVFSRQLVSFEIRKVQLTLGPTRFPVCITSTVDGVTNCEAPRVVSQQANGIWGHDGRHIEMACIYPSIASIAGRSGAWRGLRRADILETQDIAPCCDLSALPP
jgi:hypothetical protein